MGVIRIMGFGAAGVAQDSSNTEQGFPSLDSNPLRDANPQATAQFDAQYYALTADAEKWNNQRSGFMYRALKSMKLGGM